MFNLKKQIQHEHKVNMFIKKIILSKTEQYFGSGPALSSLGFKTIYIYIMTEQIGCGAKYTIVAS